VFGVARQASVERKVNRIYLAKKSDNAVQFIGYWCLACPAALCTSEKRFAA